MYASCGTISVLTNERMLIMFDVNEYGIRNEVPFEAIALPENKTPAKPFKA